MIKVKLKVGGNIYPLTEKMAKHSEAQVVDITDDGEVIRVLDELEWKKLLETPTPVKAPPKKKASKTAIPDIDVSDL